MIPARWRETLAVLAALGLLLALAVCSAGSPGGRGAQANNAPTHTAAPSPTPALTPPVCTSHDKPGDVSTLPHATFTATNVFAQGTCPRDAL